MRRVGRRRAGPSSGPAGSATEMPAEAFVAANGSGSANGNGHMPSRTNCRARTRPSARQMEFARSLAGRRGLDAEQLDGICQRLFKKPLGELSGGEASGLILALQELREGWQGRTTSIARTASEDDGDAPDPHGCRQDGLNST